jgi:hypothetical protein
MDFLHDTNSYELVSFSGIKGLPWSVLRSLIRAFVFLAARRIGGTHRPPIGCYQQRRWLESVNDHWTKLLLGKKHRRKSAAYFLAACRLP